MIVAFEGIDACGKNTQMKMLEQYAQAHGLRTAHADFPNYTSDSGQKIYNMLQLPDAERDPLVLQSLMNTNRYEAQRHIVEAHLMGKLVILDRYWMSGWVYGQTDGLDSTWLETISERLMQPHQWIVLDMPVEESFRRRPVREDAYERNNERLAKARGLYLQASRRPCFDPCAVISAGQPEEKVHVEVLRCCEL